MAFNEPFLVRFMMDLYDLDEATAVKYIAQQAADALSWALLNKHITTDGGYLHIEGMKNGNRMLSAQLALHEDWMKKNYPIPEKSKEIAEFFEHRSAYVFGQAHSLWMQKRFEEACEYYSAAFSMIEQIARRYAHVAEYATETARRAVEQMEEARRQSNSFENLATSSTKLAQAVVDDKISSPRR